MFKSIQTFDELKRTVYMFIVPGMLLALVIMLVFEISHKGLTFEFHAGILFIVVFMIGWLLVYLDVWVKYFEYFSLFLLLIYHSIKLTLGIINNIGIDGYWTFDAFSVWTPLLIIYAFIVLKKWNALWLTSLLLMVSIIPGIYYAPKLDPHYLAMLFRNYVSMTIYIILLFSFKQLSQVYVEMKAMQKKLYLDALTQVGNRHQIDNWLDSFILKAEKGNIFSILFFDIDYFKDVNDKFGHIVGDEVLKELTDVVQGELKSGQLFGRWGGEEFIILLESPECEAFQVAEHLRTAIESYDFEKVGTVTASFGVAGYEHGDTSRSIFERVDKRLYAAKESGRNNVTGNKKW